MAAENTGEASSPKRKKRKKRKQNPKSFHQGKLLIEKGRQDARRIAELLGDDESLASAVALGEAVARVYASFGRFDAIGKPNLKREWLETLFMFFQNEVLRRTEKEVGIFFREEL